MGKKSRLKRLRREQRAGISDDSLTLYEFPNPFADVPREDIDKGFAQIGKAQAEKFVESADKLQRLVRGGDPLTVLSCLAYYGLTVSVGNDGQITPRKGMEIQPSHVEILQAFYLQVPPDELSLGLVTPASIQDILDTVKPMAEQFSAKRFVQMSSANDDTDRARLVVLEGMRAATQHVRNWGFLDRVKEIAIELMRPLETQFESVNGFRSSDLVSIFGFLFEEWQGRINDHLGRLVDVFAARTVRETIDSYYATFPDLEGEKDALVEMFRERKASLADVRAMLIAHTDLRLSELSTFTPEEVASRIGRPIDVVKRAMERMSYGFGDLVDQEPEHFFMNNPVWIRPLIQISDEAYFCAIPQTFFSFWFEAILSLVQENASLRDAYDARRSSFLEDRTAAVFSSAFPTARLERNFKWHSPDRTQQFESDLVVGLDSFLFLIEAKSGRVAKESRRGAVKNLGQDIESLLVEPSRQSQRLESAILAARRGEAGTDTFLKEFPFDLSKVHRIIRLSVTLEELGFLQTRISDLKSSNYVPQDLVVAPSVSVADLEIVFEILRTIPSRVHYWVRRGELEATIEYLADEIDLLGVYLKSGLNIGKVGPGPARLMLVGESAPIDNYFEAKRVGVPAKVPEFHATEWWRAILDRMDSERPHRWTEVSVVLLCASIDQQREIERKVKSIVADVLKRREKAASRNVLVFYPGEGRSEAIAFAVLMNEEMPSRRQKMENAAAMAFKDRPNVAQVAVLVLNVDDGVYPYSTLGLFLQRANAGSSVSKNGEDGE